MSLHCIVWCCMVLYCWLWRAGCISQDTYLLYTFNENIHFFWKMPYRPPLTRQCASSSSSLTQNLISTVIIFSEHNNREQKLIFLTLLPLHPVNVSRSERFGDQLCHLLQLSLSAESVRFIGLFGLLVYFIMHTFTGEWDSVRFIRTTSQEACAWRSSQYDWSNQLCFVVLFNPFVQIIPCDRYGQLCS